MLDLSEITKNIYNGIAFHAPGSSLGLGTSIMKSTLQISLAPAIDPTKTGFAQKGEKRYKREEELYFSLFPAEVSQLNYVFTKLVQGKYINNAAKDGDTYRNALSYFHKPNNKITIVPVSLDKNNKENLTTLRIIIAGEKGKCYYTFRQNELLLFKSFVEESTKLPFYTALFKSVLIQFNALNKTNKGTKPNDVKQNIEELDDDLNIDDDNVVTTNTDININDNVKTIDVDDLDFDTDIIKPSKNNTKVVDDFDLDTVQTDNNENTAEVDDIDDISF